MKAQLTGNSALYHSARELSRRGWHVAITSRNARGTDLYAASADEAVVHAIQSKGLAKRKTALDLPRLFLLGSAQHELRKILITY